jgi:bacteriorhodopsin
MWAAAHPCCQHVLPPSRACFLIAAWTLFPILFVFGPTGLGEFSVYASNVAHAIADIISKNIWSMLGHILRIKVRACMPAPKPCLGGVTKK